jgi:DNA-nicking Smr family endonuclease
MKNRIDLHGIKHENVQRELDQFFWQMMQRGHSEVEVITGMMLSLIVTLISA